MWPAAGEAVHSLLLSMSISFSIAKQRATEAVSPFPPALTNVSPRLTDSVPASSLDLVLLVSFALTQCLIVSIYSVTSLLKPRRVLSVAGVPFQAVLASSF